MVFLLFSTLYFELSNKSDIRNPVTNQFSEDSINFDAETNSIQEDKLVQQEAKNFEGSGDFVINSLILDSSFIMKGENARITISFESLVSVDDVSISFYLKSIPSEYGMEYFQDVDQKGEIEPLILEAKVVDCYTHLNAHQSVITDIWIGPLNLESSELNTLVPLNRGSWKIIEIVFTTSDDDFNYTVLDAIVVNVIFNPFEHVVFAYFVHNYQVPIIDDLTIRYALDKTLYRMEHDYSFSIKILVIHEDNTWKPENTLLNASEMVEDIWLHVGEKLKLINSTWDFIPGYDLKGGVWTETKSANAGYDLLLAASNRPGDVLGIAGYAGNWGYVSGGRYNLLNYQTTVSQYDNILQHEISHVFGAHDRPGSRTIMDTEFIFNSTHFTSPSLEYVNYTANDIIHIEQHASTFDGSLNPTPPRILGKEKTLSTIYNTQWFFPKTAISKNNNLPFIHYLGGLKYSSRNIVLYHGTYYGNTWSNFQSISNSNYNASNASIYVDLEGNFHVVWVGVNTSTSIGVLYYRMRAYSGLWTETEVLENGTNNRDCSLIVDSQGKIHVLYNSFNESMSVLYYINKGNEENWSTRIVLPTASINAFNPNLKIDSKDCVHILWSEIDVPASLTHLYYSKYNESLFSAKEVIYTTNNNKFLTNLQLEYKIETSIFSFLWEEITQENNSLSYCEKYSNGTISEIEILYQNSKNKSLNAHLFVWNTEEIEVYWEGSNHFVNQTYLLHKIKTSENIWSFTNRYSSLDGNYYHASLLLDHLGEIHLVYCSYDYSSSSSQYYSRIYDRTIYPFDYQVRVADFSFTHYSSYAQNVLNFELSNIQAVSDYPTIGLLDSLLKTPYHNFGVWREGEGYPVSLGILSVDSLSGTWYGSAIVEDVKPGTYFIMVAFQDSNYIYSGHWKSINSLIVEDEPESNEFPQNMKILIISLSIGIPIILAATIIPSVILIKKKCRE
ncbi:MAG: hypothetical protein EAX90_01570 [Candidatus Heimdallarchaeota archaeon]|nr:hypothetical protein [Candidatus Heimdallarchaeota archaeon]